MAIWMRMTEKQKQAWNDWVAERPPVIQEMISKYNLHLEKIYCIGAAGGDRCTLYSFDEDGTVKVNILSEHNQDRPLFLFERMVFGVKPETLVEVDYPFEVVEGTDDEDAEDGS